MTLRISLGHVPGLPEVDHSHESPRRRREASRRQRGLRCALLALLLFSIGGACSVERGDDLDGLLDYFSGERDTATGVELVPPPPNDTAETGAPPRDTSPAGPHCPEGAPCDNGDPCTVGDVCRAGRCRGGFEKTCDDGDPCTVGYCLETLGCIFIHLETPECRGPLSCPDDCDDGDPCTIDHCDGNSGVCKHIPILGCVPCDPLGDWPSVCDDHDPTTEETCEESELLGGHICINRPRPCGLPADHCDDGDPCTEGSLGADCLCRQEPVQSPECMSE